MVLRWEDFMLDLKFIREHVDLVKKAVEEKNESVNIDELLQADKELTDLKRQNQDLLTQRKSHSKKIPQAKSSEGGKGRSLLRRERKLEMRSIN